VRATQSDAKLDGVVVPTTLEEYCITAKPRPVENSVDIDFYDDDYLENPGDSDDDCAGACEGEDCEEGDSGHGDS